MPRYKVKSPGYYGSILRIPGSKHDPVVTPEPLDPVPSWLEPIEEEVAKPKRVTRGAKKKVVASPPKASDDPDLTFKGGGVEEL